MFSRGRLFFNLCDSLFDHRVTSAFTADRPEGQPGDFPRGLGEHVQIEPLGLLLYLFSFDGLYFLRHFLGRLLRGRNCGRSGLGPDRLNLRRGCSLQWGWHRPGRGRAKT
jgi:hypothetical protein